VIEDDMYYIYRQGKQYKASTENNNSGKIKRHFFQKLFLRD